MGPTNLTTLHRLVRWCSRFSANIQVTQFVLNKLVVSRKVRTISQFYNLMLSDFEGIKRLDTFTAVETLMLIRQHRQMTLGQLIFGLSIPYTSVQSSNQLAWVAGTLDGLEAILADPLRKDVITKAFNARDVSRHIQLWYALEGQDIIKDLRKIIHSDDNPNGVITIVNPDQIQDFYIKGRVFYVIGSFVNTTQDRIRQMIKDAGGRWVYQYSGKVDVVICGSGGYKWVDHLKHYKVWNLQQLEKAIANQKESVHAK